MRCARCGSVLSLEGPCPKCLLAGASHHFAGLELLEPIGEGGMGTVYRARHVKLDRLVAVKFLSRELAALPELKERFTREARALAKVTHRNVVQIFDAGEEDGEAYLVMEYVDGGTLAARLPLLPREAVRVLSAVCDALQAVHDAGLVHRDVKPENVVLSTEGVLKVMDFGIAQLVEGLAPGTGTSSGTVGYMAPEQLLGEAADARADLYAVGVVLFECVTGRRPFESLDPFVLVSEMLMHAPPEAISLNADVSPAFSALLASLLLPDPAARPATAGQVAAQLEAMR